MPHIFWPLYHRYFEPETPRVDELLERLALGEGETVGKAVAVRLPRVRAGQPYPDSFYERVVVAYQAYLSAGASPAQAIAKDSGAPVTTVHRWIREARRRGLLAPARSKGRPG